MFHPFVQKARVAIYGVEAGGDGVDTIRHSSKLLGGRPGVLHGTKTYAMQDPAGQVIETHSVSAGLDYAGVGPEHAFLKDSGRVTYQLEGIVPALESAHAVNFGVHLASTLSPDHVVVINLSGRGDKDMLQVAKELGVNLNDELTENQMNTVYLSACVALKRAPKYERTLYV
ncbi:hypothetical protein PsorP6_017024 [Peronosclerospora sorghi]|uniref:Uncharacterized protein n=1 Tax=Peronosclerospora sorghi TaxID=230839 RepID=A0ACC0WDS1_9STRA|nr:hypothetical protein PsorP6_017024 [Peronosclerospora sorghi]